MSKPRDFYEDTYRRGSLGATPDTAELWERPIGERFTATTKHDNYATFGLALVSHAVDDLGRWFVRHMIPNWERVRCKHKSGESPEDYRLRCIAKTRIFRRELILDACNADLWLMDAIPSRIAFGWLLRTLGYDVQEFRERMYAQFRPENLTALRSHPVYVQHVAWCNWLLSHEPGETEPPPSFNVDEQNDEQESKDAGTEAQ